MEMNKGYDLVRAIVIVIRLKRPIEEEPYKAHNIQKISIS